MCQCKNKIAKKIRIKSHRRKIEGGGNKKKTSIQESV